MKARGMTRRVIPEPWTVNWPERGLTLIQNDYRCFPHKSVVIRVQLWFPVFTG
jgi:hypothetical protein